MKEPGKTNRLVGSRMTEEMVAETWHRVTEQSSIVYNREIMEWLESDAMNGRWCVPASGVNRGLYFEFEEDRLHFWMLWS